jgi:Fungal N-terminal domain of STAND proteins
MLSMDPLSLAASITALISIADVAVTRGMKFCRSVREQPKQMSTLIGEAAALSGVLSALRRIVEQKGSTLDMEKTGNGDCQEDSAPRQSMRGDSQSDPEPMPTPPLGKMEPVLLQSCQQTLEQLRDMLARMESREGETVMNTAKRLRWPFMESEMNDLLAKLERHKSSFQLAISVDST